jgi:nucleoporin POM152
LGESIPDNSSFFIVADALYHDSYHINGKSFTQEAKVSPISFLQQQPGEFAITSVAHQEKMCKTAVTDLRFVVHHLPSAHVGHGRKIFQDIHEGMRNHDGNKRKADMCFIGDQAEIVFTLIGEPPFTFTYQRSEPSTKKGKPGRVLETHTVSGVMVSEYSIYSALEGKAGCVFSSFDLIGSSFRNMDGNVHLRSLLPISTSKN